MSSRKPTEVVFLYPPVTLWFSSPTVFNSVGRFKSKVSLKEKNNNKKLKTLDCRNKAAHFAALYL